MKSFFYSAAIVASLLTVYAVANAQANRAAAPAAPQIAVIDVSYIFKKHARLQQQTEQMKKEVEKAEESLKAERESITRLMKELENKKPGTPAYAQEEAKITHMQAEWQAKTALQKKEFLERESKMLLSVYREVQDAVQSSAKRHGVALVLKYTMDPVDPNNRESIVRELNKPVMFQDDIDMTFAVLDDVNRGSAPAGAARAAGPAAMRPGVPNR